jgi:hypothetical protein
MYLKKKKDCRCISVVEYLPSMCQVLDMLPNTSKKKGKRNKTEAGRGIGRNSLKTKEKRIRATKSGVEKRYSLHTHT